MKLVTLTSVAVLAASTAFAGNPAPFTPADTTVQSEIVPNEGKRLGSAAWIVPVVALALVAGVIAVNKNKKDKEKDGK